MSPSFDPYAEWLGIQSKQRPPNYYRLLGLNLFEADPAAISHGAARRLHQLGVHLSGENAELVKRLFGEIEIARQCLLEPMMKMAYDVELQKCLAPDEQATPGPPIPPRTSSAPPPAPNRLRILPNPPPVAPPVADSFDFLEPPPPVVWYKRYGLIPIMLVTCLFLCGVIVASNWVARSLMSVREDENTVATEPALKTAGADSSDTPIESTESVLPKGDSPNLAEDVESPITSADLPVTVENEGPIARPSETIPPEGVPRQGTSPSPEADLSPVSGQWLQLADATAVLPLPNPGSERLSPGVDTAIDTLQKAMAQRNLPEAQRRLDQAQKEIVVEDDRRAVIRNTALVNAWKRFWLAVAASAAALQPGDRFLLDDQTVQVRETFGDRIVVQVDGQVVEYPIRINQIDRRLAVALAGRTLQQSGPAGFVPLAAFEMTDAQGDPDRAVALLESARLRGVWVDPIRQQLARQLQAGKSASR